MGHLVGHPVGEPEAHENRGDGLGRQPLEEGGQAEVGAPGGKRLDDGEAALPRVGILSPHGVQLGIEDAQRPRAGVEPEGPGRRRIVPQDLQELLPDALRGELGQMPGQRLRRGPCPVLDLQLEAPGEAEGAEDAQVVLTEALRRRSHGTQDSPVQVPQAIEGIEDLFA